MSRDREPGWARLDVDYFRNPKIAQLSDSAVVLHLSCILWCKEQGTNGAIPSHMRSVIGTGRVSRATHARAWQRLISASLLHPEPDGWTLAGFDERNGDEAAREAARAYERDRKRDQREARNVP